MEGSSSPRSFVRLLTLSRLDTVKETLRKELLYLQPILTNRKDILAEFYVWTAHVRSKMAEEARTQAVSIV
jgi:hypothetical protein